MIKTADNVSSLFEKMTIVEIQEYERNTRLEIEKLKEDLRVMVGERYRDLIEAADTIGDMKESVEKISDHVKNMHSFTTTANGNRERQSEKKSLALKNKNQSKPYYSIATEIKLLVDIPSKIWVNIESGNFLNAAQLYLFAQHVHTNLEFEMKQKKDLCSTQFGIVNRQWASIVQFRTFILNYCNDVIKSSGINEQRVAKSICALLCLTDSSPRKLCSDFLVTKMNGLENVLSSQIKIAIVKDQIALTIASIMETICLVYCIFYPIDNGDSLLYNIAKSVTDKTQSDLLHQIIPMGTVWVKYLPSSITGFNLTIPTIANVISEEFLKETCTHWITTVKQALNNGIARILSYINNIKGIATLQESLEETLLNIHKNETWTSACNAFFQRELNIWEEFLSSLFVDRIKAILESHIERTFQQTKTVLNGVFDEMVSARSSLIERDICGYVWTEESGDMPVKFAWKDGKGDKDGGNLTMKVKGFTPRVQHICQNLDSNLKLIVDDVGCFVSSCSQLSHTLSFNAAIELEAVRSHLQVICNDLIKRIVKFIKESVTNTANDENSNIVLNRQVPRLTFSRNIRLMHEHHVLRALFLARLCSAFCELCINLQKGITGGTISPKEYNRDYFNVHFVPGKLLSQKAEDNALWLIVVQMLNDENLALFNLWKSAVCEDFSRRSKDLVAEEPENLLKYLPRWDTIEIREENEEGVSVNSTISVPMQPSIKLAQLLYWLCLEINKVGGHIIPRLVLLSLQSDIMHSILTVYENYLSDVRDKQRFISQPLSLQMSFDVKYVAGLLAVNIKTDQSERIQALCDGLENYVDPFDLDVFSSHINNHLKRCIQRSIILLGPINNRSGIYGGSRPISSHQQEQHNVLALSVGSRTRFTLLPCGITSTKPVISKPEVDEVNASIHAKKSLRNQNSSNEKARSASPKRSSTPPPAEIAKSASSSFFGAMSSSWFGS